MIKKERSSIDDVVIRLAGDSGDGIQLIGSEFTIATALAQNDIGTFPDFPAEIRAPAGTLAGVSGFQIHFGSHDIYTPGDYSDVLIVMNAAALKKNLSNLKKNGIIIANEDGFDAKNLRLANIADHENPLKNQSLDGYKLYIIPITKLVKEALKNSGLGTKEIDRSKNMFVLGLICWMYDRSLNSSIEELKRKFANKPEILSANLNVLQAGFNYGETAEIIEEKYTVAPAPMEAGTYRGITGNTATALGLVAASVKSKLQLFYGTYPITPASDILHELSKHKNFGVITYQAEDEIAAISSAIGASYGGLMGVTASSGPGIDLKSEALGLAIMLELPLVIINVQRAGPSTGMPTKTEQADLLLSFFGRHGEAPMPILAANSPADCFDTIYEAARIALEYMTPVYFLSDAYIANGSEPWKFPNSNNLKGFNLNIATEKDITENKFYPYLRNENLVRKWALPGTPGLENRIGGIEKEDITGNISYDPNNHEKMVHIRANKVEKIASSIPLQQLDSGPAQGKILILGWGSTYGIIKTACLELAKENIIVSHAHLKYLNPFPSNFGEILEGFETVLIPEMNMGQLSLLIKNKYLKPVVGLNKIKGLPFSTHEIVDKVKSLLSV